MEASSGHDFIVMVGDLALTALLNVGALLKTASVCKPCIAILSVFKSLFACAAVRFKCVATYTFGRTLMISRRTFIYIALPVIIVSHANFAFTF